MRGISSGSFRNTTARIVPNSTLVSRKAPTSAIGRDRHRPDRDAVGGHLHHAATGAELPVLRHQRKDVAAAPHQRIDRHRHADANEDGGGIGMGIAGGARADAVDQRVGADRHRGEERKPDGTLIPVQLGEIPAAAQRQQQHTNGQHRDAEPAEQPDMFPEATPPRRSPSSAAPSRAPADRPAPCHRRHSSRSARRSRRCGSAPRR